MLLYKASDKMYYHEYYLEHNKLKRVSTIRSNQNRNIKYWDLTEDQIKNLKHNSSTLDSATTKMDRANIEFELAKEKWNKSYDEFSRFEKKYENDFKLVRSEIQKEAALQSKVYLNII